MSYLVCESVSSELSVVCFSSSSREEAESFLAELVAEGESRFFLEESEVEFDGGW